VRETRRNFLITVLGGAAALELTPGPGRAGSQAAPAAVLGVAGPAESAPRPGRVALIKTDSHRDGVLRALRLLPQVAVRGRTVAIKPNLNSSDPFPGSTHAETLRTLVEFCKIGGAGEITIADRSGMGDTAQVMRDKGLDVMARGLGVQLVPLDRLSPSAWVGRTLPGAHWRRGVLFPIPFERADIIIQTCCLKTHRFGGQFTLSLKNSVGIVARRGPDGYDYMEELHGSPLQRTLIAELNVFYRPALVVVDGIEAFVDGGPETGRLARPGVVLAGTDRVALDAVGVALLRMHGVTGPVAQGPIFEQEQIRRAVELGLGTTSDAGIELVTDTPEGQAVIASVRAELGRG